MPKVQKVNLHDMHENIAQYFQSILTIHMDMVKLMNDRLAKEEITASEFYIAMRDVSLAPAVLTVIATFLKTNDIRVIPEKTGAELNSYADMMEKYKASGTSVSDCDPEHEVN